ncbi:MAG: hypothetical protein OXB88_10265, partial [Bacteriovoracales bacterium]|nr:hypothetical protein [Bacteriovoracales bacterium]
MKLFDIDNTPLGNGFKKCPRCNEHSFEKLKTYGHCVNCLFIKDFKEERKRRRLQRIKSKKRVTARTSSKNCNKG